MLPGRESRYHAHSLISYSHTRREYELTVRQEPKQARMCGVGGKADRRPIDPPPIVQLRVIDPDRTNARARGRQRSPGGRRSTDSDEDEDEIMDERGQDRLVFFSLIPVGCFLLKNTRISAEDRNLLHIEGVRGLIHATRMT